MEVPTTVNKRWSMDFVWDQLTNGRRFRVLNVVNAFSREMVADEFPRIPATTPATAIKALPSIATIMDRLLG